MTQKNKKIHRKDQTQMPCGGNIVIFTFPHEICKIENWTKVAWYRKSLADRIGLIVDNSA